MSRPVIRRTVRLIASPPQHRSYTPSDPRASSIPQSFAEKEQRERTERDQLSFLHAADSKHLATTLLHNHALQAQVSIIQTYITSLPSTTPRRTDLLSKTHDYLHHLRHVADHLTDLQTEPYPPQGEAALTAWAAEILKLSDEDKGKTLEGMLLQEEADLKRREKEKRYLSSLMEELEGAGEKRRTNPFVRREGGADAPAVEAVEEADEIGVVDEDPVKHETKAPMRRVQERVVQAPVKPMSLLEMQAALEQKKYTAR